jgi:aminopeptidase N
MVLDDDFETVKRLVDGTLITVLYDGRQAAAEGAEIALAAAADSLRAYGELFGPYPFTELDLVETELAGALGVSWSGVIFLDSNQLIASQAVVQDLPDRLRFTVLHEVGHQWWGGVVGVDSNDHTFLLEGLTNYLAVVATEILDGPEEAERQFMIQCVGPFLQVLAQGGDGVADQPIDGDLPRSFATLIYGKAAIGFHAIRLEMGDVAFFAAIADWAETYSFRISEPDGLLDAFEAAGVADVEALWRFWFNEAETTVADVEALLELGAA